MSNFPGILPEHIDNFTYSQVDLLLDRIQHRRSELPAAEVTLHAILNALYNFMGVDTKAKPSDDIGNMPISAGPMTEEEIVAFEKAGWPSPMQGWLMQYRKDKRCSKG